MGVASDRLLKERIGLALASNRAARKDARHGRILALRNEESGAAPRSRLRGATRFCQCWLGIGEVETAKVGIRVALTVAPLPLWPV
jgi:hypothetical protein